MTDLPLDLPPDLPALPRREVPKMAPDASGAPAPDASLRGQVGDLTPVPGDLSPSPATTAPRAPRFAAALLAVLALAFMAALALWHERPPQARDANAPATVFSADRAMTHLRRIAQVPHPVGSAANAAVRDDLVAQLRQLGLQVEVQDAFAVPRQPGRADVGRVHNVVARLPGRVAVAPALLLAAHYDSVAAGPGAADDGAAVAAILETVRALQAAGPLRDDLVVLFTDGEEAGLLGSEAFVASHPLARRTGLALNFEYRGNRGPVLMFETSSGNAALVDGLAAAGQPVAASWQYEVYQRLPNDTDLSTFKRAGIAGMNFAAIDGAATYHSALDTVDRLDAASLQHAGDQMLALARRFGDQPLPLARTSDAVYADVPGAGLVRYPARWGAPIAWALALAFVALLWQAARTGSVRPARVFAVLPFVVLVTAACAALSQVLWLGVNMVHPGYRLMPDTYNAPWYLLAFAALFTALHALVLKGLGAWFDAEETGYAGAALWVVVGLFVAGRVSGASALFAWPLAGTFAALAWLQSARGRAASPERRLAVRTAGALPALMIFTPLLHTVFVALSPRVMVATGAVLMLLLTLLAPLVAALTRARVLPALAAALALAGLAGGAATAGFDAGHRRADSLAYAQLPIDAQLQPAAAPALWLSTDRLLDGWTQGFFPPGATRHLVSELHGAQARLSWTGPAPGHDYAPPLVQVLHDQASPAGREVTLHLASARGATELRAWVEDAVPVLASDVQGRPFTTTADAAWHLAAHGLDASGVDVVLRVPAGRPLALRVSDLTDGLPPGPHPARPADAMAQPASPGDTTEVFTRRVLP